MLWHTALFSLLLLFATTEGDIMGPPKPSNSGPSSNTPPTPPVSLQLDKEGCFEDSIDWRVEALQEWPTVFLAIIARNADHILHNYLGYIENLDYPKDRMIVWITTDNNIDNTTAMLKEWMSNVRNSYTDVIMEEDADPTFNPGNVVYGWDEDRLVHISRLRQRALDVARQKWADYIFYVDVDNLLVNDQTLKILVQKNKPIIAPMLSTSVKDEAYSNYWCGTGNDGYYKRTPLYIPTKQWQRNGTFMVPMVHSTMLVNLRLKGSKDVNYLPPPEGYTGSIDDIILFALSAKKAGLYMYLTNEGVFGYLMNPDAPTSREDALQDFIDYKLQTAVSHPPIPVSSHLSPIVLPPLRDLGLDAIFMINLWRRPDRRNRMFQALHELRINFTYFPAIDRMTLNDTYLDSLGVKMLPGWADPWGERPISKGEIGCFLSHYFIWQKMIENNWETILIIEDDIDFQPNFNKRVVEILVETEKQGKEWDLIYAGRKRLHPDDEFEVKGFPFLVHPEYSYWTLGYLLRRSGAEKLLAAEPLGKILPVDEFLPIMYRKQPEKNWAKFYPTKNLIAYSANPLLIFPTHYVGDKGHFSDTEPSMEWVQWKRKEYEQRDQKEKTRKAVVDKVKEEL
jgi:collagen beta-1,O-galactosyltransferase